MKALPPTKKPSLQDVREGAERAYQRILNWPKWMQMMSTPPADPPVPTFDVTWYARAVQSSRPARQPTCRTRIPTSTSAAEVEGCW